MRQAFIILLILSTSAQALTLSLQSPKDKLITYDEVITLSGQGSGLSTLAVNRVRMNINENGTFSCGLVLNRGKNYIEVVGWDASGKQEKELRRVLRQVTFPDMEEKYDGRPHWARRAVIALASLGIAEGYPDGNFYPNHPLTRGEMASWLARSEGLLLLPPSQDISQDVPKEHWRSAAIQAVLAKNYMTLQSANYFGINEPLTRGEAAKIVIDTEGRAFEEEVKEAFLDVPETHPFFAQIRKAKEKKLMKGISLKSPFFEPNRDITRAEAAILYSRFGRVKWLSKWLFDFNQGFEPRAYSRINTAPRVEWVSIAPNSIPAIDENPVRLIARINDREGRENLLTVKADLSALDGPPDAEMFDDGTHGDAQANDSEFALAFSAAPQSWGEKTILVTAIDRYGWQGSGQTTLTVTR
ncbi:MAG: S-layer homology domain-containing protein [Candidatus Margulisiibacteriota bacterium]